jgi:hypothetical protein
VKGPPKETGALLHAPIKKLAVRWYHSPDMAQVPPWWIEAKRLGQEFRRTHQERHLQALARHLDGVFERLTTERARR